MLKKAPAEQLKIHIQNKPIQVFQCKTLVATLDENLCWKSNTYALCKKISSVILLINTLRSVDKKTLLSVYNAIIQPYFIPTVAKFRVY